MIDQTTFLSSPKLPQTRLRPAAQAFEASFLAQMLTAAGAAQMSEFAGGHGEQQFASFLVQAQADRIAARGGIGLAETIVRHFSAKDA